MPLAQGTQFIYTVQPGDTLYSISSRLGSKVEQIEQLNALYPPFTDPGLIFPGEKLIVPYLYNPMNQVFYFVAPGDTLYMISLRFSADMEEMIKLNPQIINPDLLYVNQLLRVPARIYIFSEGDSLNGIAARYGTAISDIIRANRGRPGFSPDVIYPGYGIILPE